MRSQDSGRIAAGESPPRPGTLFFAASSGCWGWRGAATPSLSSGGPNILAVGPTCVGNTLHNAVGALVGLLGRGAQGHHDDHPATAGDETAVGLTSARGWALRRLPRLKSPCGSLLVTIVSYGTVMVAAEMDHVPLLKSSQTAIVRSISNEPRLCSPLTTWKVRPLTRSLSAISQERPPSVGD